MEAYIPDSDNRKQAVVEFFAQNDQQFLPILELLINAKQQLHDVAHGIGVAAIEGLLELSASEMAGAPHPGKARPASSPQENVRRHGHQDGVVAMGKSKLRVKRPRLGSMPDDRGRTHEVVPPAYAALKNDPKLASRMMEVALGGGVSTRKYKKTLDQTADAVGISKSEISRQLKKAMTAALEEVQARVIPGAEILAVYIDGFVVGDTHVIGAIGVKKDGTKRVLGVRAGASENLTVVEALLTDLRDRGLSADVPAAVCARWGQGLAQRRRRGVWQERGGAAVPEPQVPECAGSPARQAAGACEAGAAVGVQPGGSRPWHREAQGVCRRPGAWWLEQRRREFAGGAGGIVHGAGIGPAQGTAAVPGTTNLLDAAHSGTRGFLRRVGRWRDGDMATRWVAAAIVETEKHFRKVHGYKQLWMLEANVQELLPAARCGQPCTRQRRCVG